MYLSGDINGEYTSCIFAAERLCRTTVQRHIEQTDAKTQRLGNGDSIATIGSFDKL